MATSSTAMGKIMRASPWFAALCVSLGAAGAHGADGLELASRIHGAVARFEAADAPPASAIGMHEASPARAAAHGETAWLLPACRTVESCDAGEGRLFYRGARRYMPAWEGLAAEGISLRRDRLVLRYSFR